MQVARRRRWSAVLIAGSAVTPKGACMRVWLGQSGRRTPGRCSVAHGNSVRAGAAPSTYGYWTGTAFGRL